MELYYCSMQKHWMLKIAYLFPCGGMNQPPLTSSSFWVPPSPLPVRTSYVDGPLPKICFVELSTQLSRPLFQLPFLMSANRPRGRKAAFESTKQKEEYFSSLSLSSMVAKSLVWFTIKRVESRKKWLRIISKFSFWHWRAFGFQPHSTGQAFLRNS